MKSTRLAPAAENGRRSVHNLLLCALLSLGALSVPSAARATDAEPPEEPVGDGGETVVEAPERDPRVPREDLTASASVITADRTPRSGETLPQLLSELPGVTVTRYGSHGSLSTLSVRGSSPNQVAVYADGVPLTSAVTGALDLGLVPLTGTQRIELYRGSSPLGFGSSAMGGVVALTTEMPERSGVALHSGVGSFGTRIAGGEAALVGRQAAVLARADLFQSRADFPYRSDNRTLFDPSDDRTLRRTNNQLEQSDASLRGTAELPGGRRLRLALAGFQRSQGLPARGTESSVSAALHRRRAHGSLTYQSSRGPTDDLGPGGALEATLYGLLGEQRFEDPLQEISYVPSRTRDRSRTFGATVTASKWLVPELELSALLDGRHEAFLPSDSLRPGQRRDGRRDFGAAGLGVTASLPWSLTLLGSVRAELARDEVGSGVDLFGQSPESTAPSRYLLPIARVGLAARVHPVLRLRANAGRYARLPTLFERYGNGGFIQGNHVIGPESGLHADAGATLELEGRAGGLGVDGGIFAARSRDLIHFQERGPFASFANVARSRTLGAELAVHGRRGRHAHLFLQSTLLRTLDASGISGQDGRVLPQQPLWRGYARPELRHLPIPMLPGIEAGAYADAEATGRRYQDPANLVRQPTRFVFGAGGFVAHAPTGLRLVASAYNLTAVQSPDALYFPLPGRSFFVTLHFTSFERDPS